MTCQNCGHVQGLHERSTGPCWNVDYDHVMYPVIPEKPVPCMCEAYRCVPEVTDLPDAVVEAAAEGIGHDSDCSDVRTPSGLCTCGSVGTARAALAAASGPWAERLLARIAELEKEVHIGEEMIEQQHKELKAEEMHADPDAGCVVCDHLMIQEVIDERDAALARNAELQAQLDELVVATQTTVELETVRWERETALGDKERAESEWDDWKSAAESYETERDAARAELDNLRNRVTALADKWEKPSALRAAIAPTVANTRWSDAQELRAIVRGSDDE